MTAVTEIVVVDELTRPEDLSDPIALYRDVFNLRPEDPAPSRRLLTALARNGGTVLAGRKAGELVGFSYGFLGADLAGEVWSSSIYHYMELLVVRAGHRGTGIGRALMYHLRAVILARGLCEIRWAYDPLRTDNAYFYLDVLGARGFDFAPNLYGIENTGRDRGRPTDRIIARWDLTAPAKLCPRPPAGLGVGVPEADPSADTETVLLAVPADIHDSAMLRQRICAALSDLIASGYQAVSCRRAEDGLAVYRFVADTVLRAPYPHNAPHRSSSG
ncbi:GNAT family N-acetyltransferase [Nocardia suismassiliense]|uniref:GNAT family N-acetyltransferase n=1 Tax=Nocardia suismassiliense TaxID=2077092 RepID=A0ABW6R5L3_9NOCA